MTVFKTLLVDWRDRIATITLNRPQVRNAINREMLKELNLALSEIEQSDTIKCTILTGSQGVFAAGADVREMSERSFSAAYLEDFEMYWDRFAQRRKPVVAAVSGYALGGGCELAMMCDIIIASETTQFGQPEANVGIIPGAGGTQRLCRLIGRVKAMDLCLTGRMMGALEAERSGLVSRVVSVEKLMAEATEVAESIVTKSLPALLMTKECIDFSSETSLAAGMMYERRLFHAAFATSDQKEGVAAFREKRKAKFKDC